MSPGKPHTDTAKAESFRLTASAGRSWFSKKRCLPFCMAQSRRNPRPAPAGMQRAVNDWSRLNLSSSLRMIWTECAGSKDIEVFTRKIVLFLDLHRTTECYYLPYSRMTRHFDTENGARMWVWGKCSTPAHVL